MSSSTNFEPVENCIMIFPHNFSSGPVEQTVKQPQPDVCVLTWSHLPTVASRLTCSQLFFTAWWVIIYYYYIYQASCSGFSQLFWCLFQVVFVCLLCESYQVSWESRVLMTRVNNQFKFLSNLSTSYNQIEKRMVVINVLIQYYWTILDWWMDQLLLPSPDVHTDIIKIFLKLYHNIV